MPEPSEMEASLAALQDSVDAVVAANDKRESPSGEVMPTGDDQPAGWALQWSEDFDTDCAEGEFSATFPNVGVYPGNYVDTSKRGHYDPSILSVAGSVLRKRIHTTPDGVHHVAAILPELSFAGKWGDVSGGRFAVRFRADRLPTYKIAWLLWPQSGTWPRDGEIDFPECDLDGDTIQGFMHRQDATAGSDQSSFRSAASLDQWHTCTIEWRAGVSLALFLDGVQLGATQTVRVPSTPMHWCMQTETILNKATPIDDTVAGNVEVDWVCYWAPA